MTCDYHSWRWQWPLPRRRDLVIPVYRPWRWRTNIKKHYRVLDLEDVYDVDDFFKVEVTAGAYYDFMSPNEARRKKYQQLARARAEKIVAEIGLYKQVAVWRKRLRLTEREFDFVFEPYRQQLMRKFGWRWRWVFEEQRIALNNRVWLEMRRLAWASQQQQRPKSLEPAMSLEPPKPRRTKPLGTLEPEALQSLIAALTNLRNLWGVQWQALETRAGSEPRLGMGFPEDTVLQFVKDPYNDIGNRLDGYGLDWQIREVNGKHWLSVIWPVPEVLNWIKQGTPKL